MHQSLRSRINLASAVMAMSMAPGLGAAVSVSDRQLRPDRPLREALSTSGSWYGRVRSKGWSVAVDRRRAKKAKNVARNRRAHR